MGLLRKASGWLSDLLGGGSGFSIFGLPTHSGKTVTPENSIQVTAVWACVKILAETQGTLPLNIYKRKGNGRAVATDHPLFDLLHNSPNPEMSAADFFMSQTAQLALWGNCYSRIARNRSGQVIALWPLQSRLMNVGRENNGAGDLKYEYSTVGGQKTPYRPDQILHPRTLSWDGITGISPIAQVANAIGLAKALEEYGSRFFSNGAIPAVALEHPGRLGPEGVHNIRDAWKRLYGGNENAHEVGILEEGMKIQVLGTDAQKSQSLESRKFQIGEIARSYRIPLHMLADLERATFSNIEQQSLEFVVFTLMPWLEIWEQSLNRSLLTPAERQVYFIEHNVAGLLRGDLASRYGAYALGRQWGWLSVNDILKLENMNGIGPKGDIYLSPLNMTAATDEPAPPPAKLPPGDGKSEFYRQQAKAALVALAAMGRD